MAQQTAAEDGSTVDDIVVTARQRSENLQDVPLSIRALSAAELDRRNVRSLQDVAQLTPGLSFNEFKVGSLAVPTIRGLAQTDVTSLVNNVAVFLDGVYLGAKPGLNIAQLDLERIEVLKGPQSARYGRGAFAGAINYVTKEPGSALDGRVTASLGSDQFYSLRASVAGPITSTLSARIAIGYDTFDGTYNNQFTPFAGATPIPGARRGTSNIGGSENKTVTATLVYKPIDGLKVRGTVYYNDGHRDPGSWRYYRNNCGNAFAVTERRYYCGELPKLGKNDLSLDSRAPGIETQTLFSSLLLDYEFESGYKISLLNGYNYFKFSGFEANERVQPNESRLDPTTTSLATNGQRYSIEIFRSPISSPRRVEEWSTELRLATPDDKRLRLEGGGFLAQSEYRTETIGYLDRSRLPAGVNLVALPAIFVSNPIPGTGGQFAFQQLGSDKLRQKSVFGAATFDITPALKIGAEGRYTWETVISRPVISTTPVTDPRLLNARRTFGYFAPRLTVDYRFAETVLVFASAAKGVKPGGFNARGTDDELTFDPEQNWTYEGGIKTTLFDRRLTANASIFYTDWTNLQFATPSKLPTQGINITANIAGASARGVEFELNGKIAPGVSLGANYSYTDAKYDDGTSDPGQSVACDGSRDCSSNVSGNQLPRYSRHQVAIFGELRTALTSSFEGYLTGSYSYRSRQFADTLNARWVGSREIVNVKAGVESRHWNLSAWIDNLTNERDPLADTFAPRSSVFLFLSQAIYGDLRRFGSTLTYRF